MTQGPAIIVKKGGFLSSLAVGVFSFLTTAVVSATALGLYGMHIANDKVGLVLGMGARIVEQLPEWQKAMPPAVSDALADRRDPAYRGQLEVKARLSERSTHGRQQPVVVIEATNTGDSTVSMLALHVVVESDEGSPTGESVVYAATPISIAEEMRGPILPGSTRRLLHRVHGDYPAGAKVSVEVSDVRVWEGTPTVAKSE